MTVPALSPYVKASPYHIIEEGSSYYLCRHNERLDRVVVVDKGDFHRRITSDGHTYSQIALIHGEDCLASTVLQQCHFWGRTDSCRFCGIGLSLKDGLTIRRKEPRQLAEIAEQARRQGINHVVLTSGSSPDGPEEIEHLAACTRAIKRATAMPVQVQCRPPGDLGLFEILKDAGVDSLGLHIESLDDEVLEAIAPAKADIGWPGYKRAWSKAVDLFGRGQVVTFVIMGLGERPSVCSNRLRELGDLGVYPFVVPLRPIPGTAMADAMPPPAGLMKKAYEETVEILGRAGLYSRNIKAGCGRCPACSALPDLEGVPDGP